MNYNKVIMVGRLTRDPEVTFTASSTAVCDFGLAVNHEYKKADGEKAKEVCFIDCTAFGKTAELIKQWHSKGTEILIEGRLQLDKWQDKEGKDRSKHCIIVNNWTFGSGGERRQEDAVQEADGRKYCSRADIDSNIPF